MKGNGRFWGTFWTTPLSCIHTLPCKNRLWGYARIWPDFSWIPTLVMPQSDTKSIILITWHCFPNDLIAFKCWIRTTVANYHSWFQNRYGHSVLQVWILRRPPKGGSYAILSAKATQVFCSSATACLQPEWKSRIAWKSIGNIRSPSSSSSKKKGYSNITLILWFMEDFLASKAQLHPWHISLRLALQTYRWNAIPSSPKGPLQKHHVSSHLLRQLVGYVNAWYSTRT